MTATMKRTVSLLASSTEVVCALGRRDWLVGRSHECDFPLAIAELPVLSRPKLDIHQKSSEIDRSVKDLLREGLSIYEVFSDKLLELQPEVIITQDHCKVCAVSLETLEEAVCSALPSSVELVVIHPNDLSDVWNDFRKIGKVLDAEAEATALIERTTIGFQQIQAAIPPDLGAPRIAIIEWIEPLMTAGNWMPELLSLLSAESLFGVPGGHAPFTRWEELLLSDPDIIIVAPCGYPMKQTLSELSTLFELPGWSSLRAVQEQMVYVADGNQFFNRPGPRLLESLRILAEIIYPTSFQPTLKDIGWKNIYWQ